MIHQLTLLYNKKLLKNFSIYMLYIYIFLITLLQDTKNILIIFFTYHKISLNSYIVCVKIHINVIKKLWGEIKNKTLNRN